MATVEIGGPFKILARQYWIKAENRKPPAVGAAIAVQAVQAGSSDPESEAVNLINGSGLRDFDFDDLIEHRVNPAHMWRSAKGDTNNSLEFDLGTPQQISAICVWNYNEAEHTDRGVRKMDISVWTPEAGWRKVRAEVPVDQAEGSDDYDEPTIIQLDPIMARKVRFDNFASLGDPDHIGLSEVQFFKSRGSEAAQPTPADGAEGIRISNAGLSWIPGEGAVAHNLYCGTDPQNLQLLGKVTDTQARLSRLADRTKYYWRVDEIRADGSTVKGTVWSFTTSGLIAWWKLDESAGRHVSDASVGDNAGTLEGAPQWQPAGGRIGGALEFDGMSNFIRIANKAPFDVAEEITVVAWIKVRAFDRTWQTIAAKGDYAWRLARDRDRDALQFCAGRPEDNRVLRGNINVNDGKWHHVVGVSDATRVALYVDGVLDQALPGGGKMRIDEEPVCIGENLDSTSRGRYWNGWIDEVCVFSYALSAEEVKALYSGQEPTALGAGEASALPKLVSRR